MIIHKNLTNGQWQKLSLFEQLGNIGSEVSRSCEWQNKNQERSEQAFFRALELIDLTICDVRWKKRLKEILRVREVLCDYFVGENAFNSSKESLDSYFYQFAVVARK